MATSMRTPLLLVVLLFSPPTGADETSKPPAPTAAVGTLGEWPLETLRTKDGRTYRGLVQAEGVREFEFMEVVRPAGRDMYLVIRPIPADSIAEVERLSEEDRARLAEQIEQFRSRAWVEAGRMESVRLSDVTENGQTFLAYDGPWFRFLSTSDEETTRRAVVRIEQIFRAYQQALPPRIEPKRRLSIVLYGSMEQYRSVLHQMRLEIDHPAYFSAPLNRIVAGADLAHFAERLRQIREENRLLAEQYAALNRAFPAKQRELADRLQQGGFSREEIAEELLVRKKAWEDRRAAAEGKINEVNRRNDARFEEISQRLFARLRHEAFHAYLENYLYPQDRYAFPRWLNEGLAQVFESGRLDGETLRIDAPDRERLRRLQHDLSGGYHLPMAELLAAEDNAFLITHGQSNPTERHYLYSWGLAWRLLFDHDLLRSEQLDDYVETRAASKPPIPRFEQLVGQRLPEFERNWRETMLSLRPAVR